MAVKVADNEDIFGAGYAEAVFEEWHCPWQVKNI